MNPLPNRLKRSDAFVGLHFDFHAKEDCTEVGKTLTLKMLEDMLSKTKPDYVQCDCKGHPGIASYPTKIGTAAPGFTQDPLKLWRQATSKHGVSLYMHYSGVLDEQAVKENPAWASLDAEGKPYKNGATSTFGSYVDELLIPMFQELADDYQVDGVWIDGECWGLQMDYSKPAKKAWTQATGKTKVPLSKEDPDWHDYQDFIRESFRKYIAHYLKVMHASNPAFEIASNWAYSGHMPEKAELDVDFISGDITPQNGFNRARIEARIMEGQPKPWDLMAWTFNGRWGKPDRSTKTPAQLNQEAAAVIAMGGGFQAYFKQKRDGSIFEWTMNLAQKMVQFCRDRQAFCHRATPVPQVGLILNSEEYYRQPNALLCPWDGFYTPLEGNLRNLLDNQYAVQVPMTWQLDEDINRFPVLVFSEWEYLDNALKSKLIKYVEDGGNLLVIGPKAIAHFADELGISIDEPAEEKTHFFQALNGGMAGITAQTANIKTNPNTQVLHWLYKDDEPIDPVAPASTLTQLGKGQIGCIAMDMGKAYIEAETSVARDLMGDMLGKLFPNPRVTVTGSHKVDLAINTLDGKLIINLINTFGPHADENNYTYDEIPPIGPLTVTVQLDKIPQNITRQPTNEAINDFIFEDDKLTLQIDRVSLHEIIVIEP